jgi:hypothetical protein
MSSLFTGEETVIVAAAAGGNLKTLQTDLMLTLTTNLLRFMAKTLQSHNFKM